MQLDTDRAFNQIEPCAESFRRAMINISSSFTGRDDELRWAMHLRFLTPALQPDDATNSLADGINDQLDLDDSAPVDGARNAANTTSSSEDIIGNTTCTADGEPDIDDPCSCNAHSGRTFLPSDRQLVLTEREALPDCVHYVAVSYCWQSSAKAAYSGESLQVLAAGSSRDVKCPPALLQRVINFCNFHRMNYIWIDQECIDQDNVDDKQVGIRAMDYVYQRAEMSVAVLETCLTEQWQIDVLETLWWAPDVCEDGTLDKILQVLELILSDPWFTRAWCLQEATAGSSNMVLLLPHAPTLELSKASNYFTRAGDFEFQLIEYNAVINAWLADKLSKCHDRNPDLERRGNLVIDRWFEANMPNDTNPADFESRFVCSATDAMAFLRGRANSVVSDRIAILANLCGYERRPQPVEVAKMGHNFAMCALTLAVMNGDLSLFDLSQVIPKSERATEGAAHIASRKLREPGYGFSWCLPTEASLDQARPSYLTDTYSYRMEVLSLSNQGLEVKGCVWVVDRELDLGFIRTLAHHKFDESGLEQLFTFEDKLMTPDSRESVIRDTVLTELACYIYAAGFEGLARQICTQCLYNVTTEDLVNNTQHRGYLERAFRGNLKIERSIDVANHRAQQLQPESGLLRIRRRQIQWHLMTAAIETGSLVVARPLQQDAAQCQHRAVFDTAQVGDVFLSPLNNFGCHGHAGRENWRLRTFNGQTATCGDLVVGVWEVDEGHMSSIFLT